ncbi:hypothetical protein ACFO0A_11950 [Novosphingobium tardum]|uniref:Uncharacterized protein n=1 Tax=Novosphingobium tardum TaxID=1538021 RepID=A0ABV8RQW5_9SPHN
MDKAPVRAQELATGRPAPPESDAMAKSQKKSNKEVRKPKAEKPRKQNASNPSQKGIMAKETK